MALYSFETHLSRSDLITSLSSGLFNAARVRQQIRLTLHLILTRFRNISFYRLSYFKNGLIQKMYVMLTTIKGIKTESADGARAALNTPAADNEVINYNHFHLDLSEPNGTCTEPSL